MKTVARNIIQGCKCLRDNLIFTDKSGRRILNKPCRTLLNSSRSSFHMLNGPQAILMIVLLAINASLRRANALFCYVNLQVNGSVGMAKIMQKFSFGGHCLSMPSPHVHTCFMKEIVKSSRIYLLNKSNTKLSNN